MGKDPKEKQAQDNQLKAQEQQLKANEALVQYLNDTFNMGKEQYAEQQNFLKGTFDPIVKEYAQTGFASGEKARMRSVLNEDVSRSSDNALRSQLAALNSGGYSTDAGSGIMPYIRLASARQRGEARATGLRGIEQFGAERRYNTMPLMLSRAGLNSPVSYFSSSQGFRPGSVQEMQRAPGFMEKFLTPVVGAAAGGVSGALTAKYA